MHSHLKEWWFIQWWLKISSINALFTQNGNMSCDQCWMSEQLIAVGEQSLTTLSEARYWYKKLLNYSLGHTIKFPELLGGNYPSCFTSTSIYSAISSSADSGSGKLSTLLFQPDMSHWGSNCPCSVPAFWEDALHQRELLSIQEDVPHLSTTCSKSYSFHLHLNDISAPSTSLQPSKPSPKHCCSTTAEKFHFPSQPHPFFEKLQRKLKSCTKVLILEELNTQQKN